MPQTSHPKATASQGLFASRIMFSRNPQLVRVSGISFKKSLLIRIVGIVSILLDLHEVTKTHCLKL